MPDGTVFGKPRITKSETGVMYAKVMEGTVKYSREVEDLVTADYDELGNVIGLEILDDKVGESEVQRLIELAKRMTKGKRESFVEAKIPEA